MDELQGHFIKWNKSDREINVVIIFLYVESEGKNTHRFRAEISSCPRNSGVGGEK